MEKNKVGSSAGCVLEKAGHQEESSQDYWQVFLTVFHTVALENPRRFNALRQKRKIGLSEWIKIRFRLKAIEERWPSFDLPAEHSHGWRKPFWEPFRDLLKREVQRLPLSASEIKPVCHAIFISDFSKEPFRFSTGPAVLNRKRNEFKRTKN